MVTIIADEAIATLPRQLSGKRDRRDAMVMIAEAVRTIGWELESQEQAVLERIKAVLHLLSHTTPPSRRFHEGRAALSPNR